MKRRWKILLTLLVLGLLSQIPFAYRRYKLSRLSANIRLLNSNRHVAEADKKYVEYVGVAHVHSSLGGHSTGTFADIISAAQTNRLQFVIMTEHTEKDFDTAEMTLKGIHGGILFINGNEVTRPNGDRLLRLPGSSPQVSLIAYPDDFKDWSDSDFDGVEVYNVFTNARKINPVVAFFDSLWSRHSYGDLMFATFYSRPNESLKKWDSAMSRSKLTATAGNDAHANIGFSVNDSAGKTLFGMKLDPYETSFRLVRLHVLAPNSNVDTSLVPPLDATSLLREIKEGHCFIGFDLFGDTTGFRFTAHNAKETKIQGDEINLLGETRLDVEIPIAATVVVLKNGINYTEKTDVTHLDVPVLERGIYRIEVYLPQLGSWAGNQPWIISNPIYVR